MTRPEGASDKLTALVEIEGGTGKSSIQIHGAGVSAVWARTMQVPYATLGIPIPRAQVSATRAGSCPCPSGLGLGQRSLLLSACLRRSGGVRRGGVV